MWSQPVSSASSITILALDVPPTERARLGVWPALKQGAVAGSREVSAAVVKKTSTLTVSLMPRPSPSFASRSVQVTMPLPLLGSGVMLAL